jgi:hypothetical protein
LKNFQQLGKAYTCFEVRLNPKEVHLTLKIFHLGKFSNFFVGSKGPISFTISQRDEVSATWIYNSKLVGQSLYSFEVRQAPHNAHRVLFNYIPAFSVQQSFRTLRSYIQLGHSSSRVRLALGPTCKAPLCVVDCEKADISESGQSQGSI